jgi:hypothetical protein
VPNPHSFCYLNEKRFEGARGIFMVLKEHVSYLHKIKAKIRDKFPKIYNFDALKHVID